MKFPFGPKRLATICGVLLCAFATGTVMQSLLPRGPIEDNPGIALASVNPQIFSSENERKSDLTAQSELIAVDAQTAKNSVDGIQVEDVVLTSALPEAPLAVHETANLPSLPVKLVALSDAPVSDLPQEEKAPAFTCEIKLSAKPQEAAMAKLELQAECMQNALFTVHHSGMMISAVTDTNGNWAAALPAFSENALFIASFPGGEGAAVNVAIEDLSDYDRYAVQWTGEKDVQIHAFENGATYEEDGHVWRENYKSVADAVKHKTGFVTRFAELGLANSHNVEIYTLPAEEAEVVVNIELGVDAVSCGRDLEAQAFVLSGAERLQVRDLMIAMPDCGAVGEFLVLKNLYRDLTIARN